MEFETHAKISGSFEQNDGSSDGVTLVLGENSAFKCNTETQFCHITDENGTATVVVNGKEDDQNAHIYFTAHNIGDEDHPLSSLVLNNFASFEAFNSCYVDDISCTGMQWKDDEDFPHCIYPTISFGSDSTAVIGTLSAAGNINIGEDADVTVNDARLKVAPSALADINGTLEFAKVTLSGEDYTEGDIWREEYFFNVKGGSVIFPAPDNIIQTPFTYTYQDEDGEDSYSVYPYIQMAYFSEGSYDAHDPQQGETLFYARTTGMDATGYEGKVKINGDKQFELVATDTDGLYKAQIVEPSDSRTVNVSVSFKGVETGDDFVLNNFEINYSDVSNDNNVTITKAGISNVSVNVGTGFQSSNDSSVIYDIFNFGSFEMTSGNGIEYAVKSISVNGQVLNNPQWYNGLYTYNEPAVLGESFHADSYNIVYTLVKRNFVVMDMTNGYTSIAEDVVSTIGEAGTVIKKYYDSHLENGANTYYTGKTEENHISLVAYTDFTLTGNEFLDKEGIGRYLSVDLAKPSDTIGYPTVTIAGGKTVNTYARINGMNWEGDGATLKLGAKSVFSINNYVSFKTIIDENAAANKATVKINGKEDRDNFNNIYLQVGSVGDESHPLGTLNAKYICGFNVKGDCYISSLLTDGHWFPEGNSRYSIFPVINLQGNALIDNFKFKAQFTAAEDSNVKIKKADFYVDECTPVYVRGDLEFENITLSGKDNYTNSYSECIDLWIFTGKVTFPAPSKITSTPFRHKYTFEGGYTVDEKLTPYFALTYRGPVSDIQRDPTIGESLFFTKGTGTTDDYSSKIKVRDKNWNSKDYDLCATETAGKYKAQLRGVGYYYAFEENGTFPDNLSKGEGLSVSDSKYANIPDMLEALKDVTFDGTAPVKVYIPINSNVYLNDLTMPENDRIKEIEFFGMGYNQYNGHFSVNIGSSNVGNDTFVFNKDITFRDINISTYGSAVFDIGSHNLSLNNITVFTNSYYDENNNMINPSFYGLKEVKGTGTLTIRNTKDSLDTFDKILKINVPNLIIDGTQLYYRGYSNIGTGEFELKDGINITLRGKAMQGLSIGYGSQDYVFNIGTLTVEGKNSLISLDYNDYSIDEIIVEKGASIHQSSSNPALIKARRLVVKEGGTAELRKFTVSEATELYGNSRVRCSSDYSVDLGQVKLIKGEASENNDHVTLFVQKNDYSVPVRIKNGIVRTPGAEDMYIELKPFTDVNNYSTDCAWDARHPLLDILYTSVPEQAPADELVVVKSSDSDIQSASFVEVAEPEEGYAAEYLLKPLGLGIYSSEKTGSFASARLLTRAATYADAISYIDSIGNVNQIYYISVPNDQTFGTSFAVPKVCAGFGIVGEKAGSVKISVSGNVVLPANTYLENIILSTPGSVTANGDLKLYQSSIEGMSKASTVKGILILERSMIALAGGTFTVSKDFYGYQSRLGLSYPGFGGDSMSVLINHKTLNASASPVNYTVTGKTYIRETEIVATGNVTLGVVYSGEGNSVLYGLEAVNTFKVTSVTDATFTAPGSERFDWIDGIAFVSSESPLSYYVVGAAAHDGLTEAELNQVTGSPDAINVRRAFVEKAYYADSSNVAYDQLQYESSDTILSSANKLAAEYKANPTVKMVTTAESAAKFIVGRLDYKGVKLAVYSLKASSGALIPDDTPAYAVTLVRSEANPTLIGNYNTINEAVAKINALKDKNASYQIVVFDGDKASNINTVLTLPKSTVAQSVRIIASTPGTPLSYKGTLDIGCNTSIEGFEFECKDGIIKLNNNGLRLNNCTVSNTSTIKSVTGGGSLKESILCIDNNALATFNVTADLKGVGTVELRNAVLRVSGITEFGNIEVLSDSKLIASATVKNGIVTPNLTISDVISGSEEEKIYIALMAKDATGTYKSVTDAAFAIDTVVTGINIAVAPMCSTDRVAFSGSIEDDFDTMSGMLIKRVENKKVYLAYADIDHVPYILSAGTQKVADCLSWADVVSVIDGRAAASAYTVVLCPDADGNVNSINAPETLTMPAAKNVGSLEIKSENSDVIKWYYTGDKIALTSDTSLENVNLVGMVKSGNTFVKITQVIGSANGGALTISAPYVLEAKGTVAFNGRHVVLDGAKKGSFVLSPGAAFVTNITNAEPGRLYIFGAVKNFKSVELNAAEADLFKYYATAANAQKGVDTNSELSATDMVFKNKLYIDGPITVTNAVADLVDNDGFEEIRTFPGLTDHLAMTFTNLELVRGNIINDTNGAINVTNLIVDGDKFGCMYTCGPITIGSMTVNGGTGAEYKAKMLTGSQITVKSKLDVLSGDIGFRYCTGAFKVDAAVNVANGSNIYVIPYKEFRYNRIPALEGCIPEFLTYTGTNDAQLKAKSEQYAFVNTSKGNADQFVPAVYNSGYISKLYDGTGDDNTVFLYKKGSVIYGANAELNIKAKVYKERVGNGLPMCYLSYDEAIASMNDNTADYYLVVSEHTSSADKPVKVTAPVAAKAASLTICGETPDTELYYSAALSFANNVTIKDITLAPTKALSITLSGAYTLTLDNVAGFGADTLINGMTATAGTVSVKDTVGAVYNVNGNVNVKNLKLAHAGLYATGTVNVSADLDLDHGNIKGADNKTVKLNNVSADVYSTVEFGRMIKGTSDNGTTLTVSGKVEGKPKFVMSINAGLPAYADYALTADDLGKGALPASKLLFTAKDLEADRFECDIPDGTQLVKANGNYYLAKTGIANVSVTLKEIGENAAVLLKTDYLDINQALKRIAEIGNINGDYQVYFPGRTITDTDVIDKVACSGLALPGDNKAATVIFNAGSAGSLKYSGNITAYGRLQLDMLKLKPCDVKGDPSSASTVTIKQNSKNNVANGSGLYLNEWFELDGVFKSVTGVAGKSFLAYYNANEPLVVSGKITQFEEVTSWGTIVSGGTASIGVLNLDEEAEFAATAASNVNNISVGDGGGVLYAAYTADKAGNFSNTTFTVNGTASGKVKVELFPINDPATGKAWVLTGATTPETLMEGSIVKTAEASQGKPIVIAKKADAGKFIPAQMDDDDTFIASNNIILYKNAAGAVIADSKDDMAVEITSADGFDTYAKTWADAVTTVDNIADKNAEYTFTVLKSLVYADKAGTGKAAMIMPKAASTSMITVKTKAGAAQKAELAYTGALNTTCNVTFDNVNIQEYTKNIANGAHTSKINVTGDVTLKFTDNAVNGASGDLTFNTVSVPKGTLSLLDDPATPDQIDIEVSGAVNVGNLYIDGSAEIIPVADANVVYPKQTYGTLNGAGNVTLHNYFTKAIPTATVGQLSITGNVSTHVSVNMSLYNANYTYDGKTYKVADGYVPMTAGDEGGFVEKFLLYTDGSKNPVARTAILNAPFLSDSQLTVTDGEGNEYTVPTSKIGGAFYFTKLTPVVQVDTDYDKDGTPDRTEQFITWDGAVLDLNKTVNNEYAYKMTLLSDASAVDVGSTLIKYGKNSANVTVIKSVPMAKLIFPSKVDDLSIDGNGHSFIFTNPALTIDSDIVFESVSFICLKKTTKKTMWSSDGKIYNVSYPDYTADGVLLSISVSKNRSVLFNEYRTEYSVSYGSGYSYYVSGNTFGNIKGTAGSKLSVARGRLILSGSVTGFDEVNVTDSGSLVYTYGAKAAVNTNVLNVKNSGYISVSGDVTAKKITLEGGNVWAAGFTADDVYFEGTTSNYLNAVEGVGKMTAKNLHVNGTSNNHMQFKQTAKGVTQSTINAIEFADGCEDNKINIGVMYTNNLYVSFYDGQAVFNTLPAFDASAVTLITADDLDGGHTCGEAGIDWHFEKSANGMQVIFKSGTAQ